MNARQRLGRALTRLIYMFIAIIILAAFLLGLIVATVLADDTLIEPTPAEYADIQKWISPSCCWTNRCCFKVKPSALTPLGNDEWRVEATGQVNKRTGWSRDGNTWRCTCDHINGKWVAHPKANTRCIFPVATGS